MAALEGWAREHGVQFASGVSIEGSDNGKDKESVDWGISAKLPLAAGSKVLSVPGEAALKSTSVQSLEGMREAIRTLISPSISGLSNMEEYIPEFQLFVSLLLEYAEGSSSPWHAWISSLPRTFSTGLYFAQDDPQSPDPTPFLSPQLSAIVSFQQRQLHAFVAALQPIAYHNRSIRHLLQNNHQHDFQSPDMLFRWAFSVVFTRSWRSSLPHEAVLVPLGDMFNHAAQPNVVLHNEPPASDTFEFVLSKTVIPQMDANGHQSSPQLCLSYGPHSTAHFLAVFGFMSDESTIDCVDSHIDIPIPSTSTCWASVLGCDDKSRMTYGRHDGKIADAVWDCVLCATLANHDPSLADRFLNAVQAEKQQRISENDQECAAVAMTADEFRDKYALEVALSIRAHVRQNFASHPLPTSHDAEMAMHHNDHDGTFENVVRYNSLMREVLHKVHRRLDGIVQREKQMRRRNLILQNDGSVP